MTMGLANLKEAFGQADQIVILLKEPQGMLARKLLDKTSPPQGPAAGALLNHVEKGGKPHLVLDAGKSVFPDRNLIANDEFLSAMCGTIEDGQRLRGLTLVLNRKQAGAFGYQHLEELQQLGLELGKELAEFRTVGVERAPSAQPGILWGSIALVLLAATWAVAGSYLTPGSAPPKPVATAVVKVPVQRPETAATSFLGMVKVKDFSGAHKILSKRLQQELSEDQLQAQLDRYLARTDNRKDLRSRTLNLQEVDAESCRVTLETSDRDRKNWEWKLRKEDDNWRLDSLGGAFGFDYRL